MRWRPCMGALGLVPAGLAMACTLNAGAQGTDSGMPADTEATGATTTGAPPTGGPDDTTDGSSGPPTTGPTTTTTTTTTTADGTGSSTGEPEPFFRREVTILGDQVPGTEPLLDFTVNVVFPGDVDLQHVGSGGHVLELDAADFLFRDASMQPISHEVVSYGPDSGRFSMWVRVPEVAADADTTIWLDYGAAGLVGQTPAGTWNPDYVGVWHFDGAIADGGMVLDSSPAANHGTAVDMSAADEGPGRVGGGVGFSLPNAAVQIGGGALDLPGPVTFEGWGRMDGPLAANGFQRLFNKGAEFDRPLTFWVMDETVGLGHAALGVNYEWPDFDWLELGYTIGGFTYGQWHHYAAVVGGPGGDVALFVDGVRVDSTTYGFDIELGHDNLYFGNWDTTGSSRRWNGYIDEFRFSDVARTDQWVEAGYANQLSPAAFTTVGPEQAMMP